MTAPGKSMLAYIVIPVKGRPHETEVTLRSLGKTAGIEDCAVHLLYTDDPSLSDKRVTELARESLHCPVTVTVVPQSSWGVLMQQALTHAGEHGADATVHVWLENDNLLNPDWLTACLMVLRTADRHGVMAGICAPHRILGPYDDEDLGPGEPYLMRRRLPGPAWVMTPNVSRAILDMKDVWDGRRIDWQITERLFDMGYRQLCPKISAAQHIGMDGVTMTPALWERKGSGGVGFVADRCVQSLWRGGQNRLVIRTVLDDDYRPLWSPLISDPESVKHLQDAGVSFSDAEGDVVLIYGKHIGDRDAILAKMGCSDTPLILWERWDACSVFCRSALLEDRVRLYLKMNGMLASPSDYNAPHQRGRYHYAIIHANAEHPNPELVPAHPRPVLPESAIAKIAHLYNCSFHPKMRAFCDTEPSWGKERPIDVFVSGTQEWGDVQLAQQHRRQAFAAAHALTGVVSDISQGRVHGPKTYVKLTYDSKIVVAPWGLGEQTWRDYEAIYAGCLLIKPDMSHVVTWPIPYTAYGTSDDWTYFPCAPDFSDLQHVVDLALEVWSQSETRRRALRAEAIAANDSKLRAERFLGALAQAGLI